MKKSAIMFALAIFCWEAMSAKDTRDDHAGPSRPASRVKPGPDTEPNKTYRSAQYITAFSQLRVAGPPGKDQPGVLGVMPSVGELRVDPDAYRSAFDHQDSTLKPGYFSVKLKDNDVQVDMTAIDHVAVYQFTFPESKESHVVVDVSHLLKMFRGGEVRLRDDKTIEGTAKYELGSGEEMEVAFSFQFSKPFKRRGIWEGDHVSDQLRRGRVDEGSPLGAFAYFWTHEGETILMKVGISSVDVADARKNLATEFPGWDYDQLCRESEQAWK
jgi:putative alpha-1,2-mannosidase